jgi:hypothetical protein
VRVHASGETYAGVTTQIVATQSAVLERMAKKHVETRPPTDISTALSLKAHNSIKDLQEVRPNSPLIGPTQILQLLMCR